MPCSLPALVSALPICRLSSRRYACQVFWHLGVSRFITSRIDLENSGGENPLPLIESQENRLVGLYRSQAVHFVRLATVAVAAELRHRVAVGVRGVLATNEEHRRVASRSVGINRHAVLVMAGGAGNRIHRHATKACQRIRA